MDKRLKNYLIFLLLSLIWGSSFILMKKGLEVFDFFEVASLRLFIAFLFLAPFLPKAIVVVKRQHFFPLIITAFFGNALPAFLFAKSQTKLDSALVGILNATVPLFTLLLGIFFFNAKASRLNILGVFVGFLGVVLLTVNTFKGVFVFNSYVIFVILATIFYAISINVIKKYLQDLEPSIIASLAFFIISPFISIHLFYTDFLFDLKTNPNGLMAFGYIVILSVFGTALAVIMFNRLLSSSSTIFTASITYLIPVVAIFWGLFDGESIMSCHLVALSIILSGVYLVNKANNK